MSKENLTFSLYHKEKVPELGSYTIRCLGLYQSRETMNDVIAKMSHRELPNLYVKKTTGYTVGDPKH